jgi:predicted metal-binding membrane protein
MPGRRGPGAGLRGAPGPAALDRRLRAVLARDRAVALGILGAVTAANWAYLLAGAGMDMPAHQMSSLSTALGPGDAPGSAAATAAMATPAAWTPAYAGVMVGMWWVMMLAMMLPSAAPMILLHARVSRAAASRAGSPAAPWATLAFAGAYLLAWGGFSVAAAGLQWAFEAAGWLSATRLSATSLAFAGGVLILAGLYQMLPLKQACLRHCRSPAGFLAAHWRPGAGGAFAMGLRHGAYCLGCCWALMALLFFGGVMNLYWIAGLALLVLLEKALPFGARLGQALGVGLLLWGASFALAAAEAGAGWPG